MNEGTRRLIAAVFMILILILAIIHLAVSISIIVKVRNYGDVFNPERGLAAFNLVISIYGLIIGGFGLFSVLTDRGILTKIVTFASVALAFFALVSLITALIINNLAINYVSSRFLNRMNNYINDQTSRNIVDKAQTSYNCCGNNIWLDWANVGLNATGSSTNTTATTPAGNGTTIATTTGNGTTTATTTGNGTTTATTTGNATTTATTVGNGTTTAPITGNGTTTTAGTVAQTTTIASTAAISNTTVSSTPATNASGRNFGIFNDIIEAASKNLASLDKITNDPNFKSSFTQKSVRRRRQTQSNYGGISGLPITFTVTLPESCCTNDLSSAQNLSNLYCISNANNVSNSFHTDGCSKKLAKFSVSQSLGIIVINSVLFILALAAIPVLLNANSFGVPPQHSSMNQSMPQYQQQYAGEQYNPGGYYPDMSQNNYNPAFHPYY